MDISLLLSAAHAAPPTSPVSSYSVAQQHHGGARNSHDTVVAVPSSVTTSTPWVRPSEHADPRRLPPLSLGPPIAPGQSQNQQDYQQHYQQEYTQDYAQDYTQRQHFYRPQPQDHRQYSYADVYPYERHGQPGPLFVRPNNGMYPTARTAPYAQGTVETTSQGRNMNISGGGLCGSAQATPAVTGPQSPASSCQRDHGQPEMVDTPVTVRMSPSLHVAPPINHQPQQQRHYPTEHDALQARHPEANNSNNFQEGEPEDGKPGARYFRCTVDGCDAKFGQKGSLTRHIKNRHSLNCRPHACDLCPKTFSEKWTLNVHRRNVHLKLKAHNCLYCNKSFGEKWNLRKHVNVVHLHVKPFSCHICDRAFGYKGDMVKHVAELHSSSSALRPFICDAPGCGVKFARMRYLRRHQNLNHKESDVGAGPTGQPPAVHLTMIDRFNAAAGESPGLSPTSPMLPQPHQLPDRSPVLPAARSVGDELQRPRRHVNNLSLFAAVASGSTPEEQELKE